MEPIAEEINPDDFPGVKEAFAFVLPSYQMLLSRYEAADNRLNTLLTTAFAVMAAGPVVGRAIDPNIAVDRWFWASLSSFVLAVAVGLWARLSGAIVVPNPMTLYNEAAHENEWEFKRNALFLAGRHFQKNAETIDRKHLRAVIVTALVAVQGVCFGLWMAF